MSSLSFRTHASLFYSIAGLDVSRFVVSLRDDGDQALTFRSVVLGSALTALSSVITVLYLFKVSLAS